MSNSTAFDPQAFLNWYQQLVKSRGVNPNPDDYSDPWNRYDMRQWFQNASPQERSQAIQPGNETHFTDQYKLPGYPTFSTDSNFYQPGIEQAVPTGQWLDDNYLPYDAQRIPRDQQGVSDFAGVRQLTPLISLLLRNAYRGR